MCFEDLGTRVGTGGVRKTEHKGVLFAKCAAYTTTPDLYHIFNI
jgi:hypothetical protein